jgi:hypothetical protein
MVSFLLAGPEISESRAEEDSGTVKAAKHRTEKTKKKPRRVEHARSARKRAVHRHQTKVRAVQIKSDIPAVTVIPEIGLRIESPGATVQPVAAKDITTSGVLSLLPASPEGARSAGDSGFLAPLRSRLGFGAILRADYFSASKKLDDNHNLIGLTLQPKLEPQLGEHLSLKGEGRLHDEDMFDSRGRQHRFLEGYLDLHGTPGQLRLGQQIIAWGRADALNPTDLLTPKDFTHLSAEYEVDRRFGLPAALGTARLSPELNFTAVWIPIFMASVIPIPDKLPFQLGSEEPNNEWRNHSFALKLDRSGTGVDWSISYFQGWDLIPTAKVTNPGGVVRFGPQGLFSIFQPTSVLLRNQRIRAIGADAAIPMGGFGWRAETAYVRSDDPHGIDPQARNPYWFTVAGADRDLTEDLNVNLQVYQRIVFNFEDPFQVGDPLVRTIAVFNATIGNQLDRWQTGFTGRVRATWLQKTLAAELLGVFNANRTDFYLRPMVSYAITDIWKAYLGADVFNGRRDSFFGRLENTSAVFVELRATL